MTVLYLLNVALAATGVTALGLLTARLILTRWTSLRHSLLSAALVLVLLTPLLVALACR